MLLDFKALLSFKPFSNNIYKPCPPKRGGHFDQAPARCSRGGRAGRSTPSPSRPWTPPRARSGVHKSGEKRGKEEELISNLKKNTENAIMLVLVKKLLILKLLDIKGLNP